MPTVSESDRRAWLIDHSPAETDRRLLTSLQSSLGVVLRAKTELRFPVEGGYRDDTVSFTVDGTEANYPAARARIEAACCPPTKAMAEDWLIALQAATAGGRKSEIIQTVALDLFSGILTRYPADVARAACEHFAMTRQWFPALAEIVAECDRLFAERKLMLASLSVPVHPRYIEPRTLNGAAYARTDEERSAVRRMAADWRKHTEEAAPPAYVFDTQGQVDETGITPEARALIAKQRDQP